MAPSTETRNRVVFLFDVDNTLLDNDRVTADLDATWTRGRRRTPATLLGDFRGAADRARLRRLSRRPPALPHRAPTRPAPARACRSFLVDYPFANRLFPDSLDVLEHCQAVGADGDPLGRRRRLPAAQDPALRAVRGGRRHVLIYIHKEQELDDVERRFPADHYVLVDDKLRILTAVKQSGASASRPSSRARATTRTTRRSATYPRRRRHDRAHRRPARLRPRGIARGGAARRGRR